MARITRGRMEDSFIVALRFTVRSILKAFIFNVFWLRYILIAKAEIETKICISEANVKVYLPI